MRSSVLALVVTMASLVGCPSSAPPAPPPPAIARDAGVPAIAHPVPAHAQPVAPVAAGPAPVAVVRVKNIGTTPLRVLTNPDTNELIHAYRVNVSADTSERAAMFAPGTRVMAFPIGGQMPLCNGDAGVGYHGLGQAGAVMLAPGESFEAAQWDGTLREEVNDNLRGVCAREFAPTPGRYRFQLDQGDMDVHPQCTHALLTVPVVSADGGVPVLEIRCRNPPRDAGAGPVVRPAS